MEVKSWPLNLRCWIRSRVENVLVITDVFSKYTLARGGRYDQNLISRYSYFFLSFFFNGIKSLIPYKFHNPCHQCQYQTNRNIIQYKKYNIKQKTHVRTCPLCVCVCVYRCEFMLDSKRYWMQRKNGRNPNNIVKPKKREKNSSSLKINSQ